MPAAFNRKGKAMACDLCEYVGSGRGEKPSFCSISYIIGEWK